MARKYLSESENWSQHLRTTLASQHPQVYDLLVLGLLDEELHALGQVFDMFGQGLLGEELLTLSLAKFSTSLCKGYMMESCTPLARLFTIRY